MEKRKKQSGEIGSAAKTVIFIGAAIMAMILIIGGVYIIHYSGQENEPEELGYDVMRGFADLIAEEEDRGEQYEIIEIPEMSIGEAFDLFEENSSYYQECTVSSSEKNGKSTQSVKHILRDGEKYNIKTFENGVLTETIICDGSNIQIINETTDRKNTLPKTEGVYPMELASMPSHKRLLELLREYNSAEDKNKSELSKCKYTLSRARDMNMLNIVITHRSTGITERYFYYLNFGLIFHCSSETFDGSSQPYTMLTTYFDRDISDFVTEDSFVLK